DDPAPGPASAAAPAVETPTPAPPTAPTPAPAARPPTAQTKPAGGAARGGALWHGRDGRVAVAAVGTLAASGRARMVVVRRQRRPDVHAGAARRRRGRVVLSHEHRQTGVAGPGGDGVSGM